MLKFDCLLSHRNLDVLSTNQQRHRQLSAAQLSSKRRVRYTSKYIHVCKLVNYPKKRAYHSSRKVNDTSNYSGTGEIDRKVGVILRCALATRNE